MSRAFLPKLESMRGIAAAIVAFYHAVNVAAIASNATAIEQIGSPIGIKIYLALFNGFGAVVFFFVLSGYVLARSLDRRVRESYEFGFGFLARRLFRLYPAVIATVLLFTVVFYLGGHPIYAASYDLANVVLNALIVHYDITVVAWSLKVELVATPLIFGCVLLARRYGVWPLYLTLAILIALSFWKPFYTSLGAGSNLAPLHAFVGGILVHFHGALWISWIRQRLTKIVFIGALVLACATRQILGLTSVTILIESLASTIMVLIVARRPDLSILAPLEFGFIRFLGRVSYSFYLSNALVFGLIEPMRGPLRAAFESGVPAIGLAFAAGILSVIITLPLAYFMWRFVEQPGIEHGAWLLAQRVRRPVHTPAAEGAMPVQPNSANVLTRVSDRS